MIFLLIPPVLTGKPDLPLPSREGGFGVTKSFTLCEVDKALDRFHVAISSSLDGPWQPHFQSDQVAPTEDSMVVALKRVRKVSSPRFSLLLTP